MTNEELIKGLTALYTASRTDAEGQWWPIRKWLNGHDIFNDDIQSFERLAEITLKYLLEESKW